MFKTIWSYVRHQEPLAASGVLFAAGDFLTEQASWRQAAIAAFVLIARQFVSPTQAGAAVAVVEAATPVLPADPRLAALEAQVKDIAGRIGAA